MGVITGLACLQGFHEQYPSTFAPHLVPLALGRRVWTGVALSGPSPVRHVQNGTGGQRLEAGGAVPLSCAALPDCGSGGGGGAPLRTGKRGDWERCLPAHA